jgi:hypothetical protein
VKCSTQQHTMSAELFPQQRGFSRVGNNCFGGGGGGTGTDTEADTSSPIGFGSVIPLSSVTENRTPPFGATPTSEEEHGGFSPCLLLDCVHSSAGADLRVSSTSSAATRANGETFDARRARTVRGGAMASSSSKDRFELLLVGGGR